MTVDKLARKRGVATVNFPYVQKRVVVTDRVVKADGRPGSASPFLETGLAFHNGGMWEVYRNTRTGQWNSWKRVDADEPTKRAAR